jgi:dipeptidyl aminopeptidase
MPVDARLISEVGWVGDDALLVKEIDRAARRGSVVIFQDGESEGKIVRRLGQDGEEGDDGWIDHVSFRLPCNSVKVRDDVLTDCRGRMSCPSERL